jgi:dolichol kinase
MALGVTLFVLTQHLWNFDPFGFFLYLSMFLFAFQFPMMKFTMKIHPFWWFLITIWRVGINFWLCIFWMTIIIISFILMSISQTHENTISIWKIVIPKIIMRKYFHVMVWMFIPGVIYAPTFMSVAYVGAFCLFVIFECLRIEYREYRIGQKIESVIRGFTDERDDGPIIITHIYLLFGCALPIWLNHQDPFVGLLGILSIGVGDSMASVCGTYFGKTKWPGSKKSVQGTIGAFLSMMLFCVILSPFITINWVKITISAVMVSLLESFTHQIDNLTLPLYFVWIYTL